LLLKGEPPLQVVHLQGWTISVSWTWWQLY